MDNRDIKKRIRKEIITKRDALSENEINLKSNLIKDKLFHTNEYINSKTIFGFISFGSEINTHTLIEEIINDGKKVGVPYTYPKEKIMIVSEIKNLKNDLEIGNYGILTPRESELKPINPKDIDLVLVPGLAFDKKGYRVGYGGGYYDRFFEKINENAIKIGLAFDLQLVEENPRDRFDIPVDYIITENDIIKIS